METVIYLLFAALICAARCCPLGQTMVCESTQGCTPYSTTVCESVPTTLPSTLPNILPYMYGMPGAISPQLLNSIGLPYGLPYPAVGSTTVCESTPAVVGISNPGAVCWNGYPFNLPRTIPYSLPGIAPVPVCDNIPNVPCACAPGCPCTCSLPAGIAPVSICESSPAPLTLGAYGIPLNSLPFNSLGLGLKPTFPFL